MRYLPRDFAACVNDDCPSKEKCLRQCVNPNDTQRQAYSMFYFDESGVCESFVPVTSNHQDCHANHTADNPSHG